MRWPANLVDCVWKVIAHAQKPVFVFRRNGRVHSNRQGRQFIRLLAAEVCASAVVMLDTPCSEVVWRVLATHSIRQFPPTLPFPCVAVCHHVATGVYHYLLRNSPEECNSHLRPDGNLKSLKRRDLIIFKTGIDSTRQLHWFPIAKYSADSHCCVAYLYLGK